MVVVCWALIMSNLLHFQCQLNVKDFWDEEKYPLVFYDMCILLQNKVGDGRIEEIKV